MKLIGGARSEQPNGGSGGSPPEICWPYARGAQPIHREVIYVIC